MGHDDEDYPGMPRWVKVSGAVLIALVLLVLTVFLFSGGDHGPGRHVPTSDPGAAYEDPAGLPDALHGDSRKVLDGSRLIDGTFHTLATETYRVLDSTPWSG